MATVHRCSSCTTPLVSITIARGESQVTMFSCSRCDVRWWHEDGASVDRSRVFQVCGTRD